MTRARTRARPRAHNPPAVAVVTDSTAYLPADSTGRLGVRVVPLQVIIGGHVRAESVEIGADEVATALTRGQLVSTSRPSPSVLAATYREAFAAGASSVVSVHLSGAMSGTVDAARMAASEVAGDVRVIDSRSIAMGMGFAVLAGAEAAAAGADADAVTDVVERALGRTSVFFYVDTLEFLRRGGRIGAARALLGSALAVKPLLCLRDGVIAPLERVRTASRALARLEEIAIETAGEDPVAVAVHHLGSLARAEALGQSLDLRLPKLDELVTTDVGAVVGAHTGPGVLGVVVCKC